MGGPASRAGRDPTASEQENYKEPHWRLDVWGPTVLSSFGRPVDLRPRERAVIAAIAASRDASLDRLIELIWGHEPPASATKSLRNHISRVRAAAGDVVLTTDVGYRLADGVEVIRPRPEALASAEPFADLADVPEVNMLRSTERQRRLEEWFTRLSATASDELVLQDVQYLVAAEPELSGGRELLIRSLAFSGRRAEALAVAGDAVRAAVRSGLSPNRELRDLERRLVDDDPTLRQNVRSGSSETWVDKVGRGHLVELDDQLVLLEASGSTSPARTIVVTGPAGIGKTTLVEHARRRAVAGGAMTVLVACNPEPSVPLEPVVAILHQLVERFPEQIAASTDSAALLALVPSLPIAPPQHHGAPPTRSDIFDAVAAAIAAVPVPLLLIVEDLHWATALTPKLLARCARADAIGVTIIATSRADVSELLTEHDTHVPLQPWTLEVVEDYMSRFGRSLQWVSDAAAWVHQQSGGNALHVRELTMSVHEHADGDVFVPPDGTPPSLFASLRRRLADLDQATRQDIDAAAVLGRRFRRDEWAAMGADIARSLPIAQAAGVVVDVDTAELDSFDVQFRHDLLHRLVLDDIPPGRIIEWHDLAADAIAARVADTHSDIGAANRADELAHHALGAASLDPHRALAMLDRSITVDTERFDYESAIEKCRAGRDLAGPNGPAPDARFVVECETRLGRLLLHVGDQRALDQLAEAAEHALDIGDDLLVAEAIRETCRLGPTSIVGKVHTRARDLLDRATAQVTDPKALAIMSTAGVMLFAISGESARCRRYFEQAVAYHGDVATRVDALSLAVLILTEQDDIDRRIALESELTELAASIGTPEARWGAAHLRMTNQVQNGDPGMRTTLTELGELAALIRQRTRLWEYTNWSASVALTDGDPARAEALATEALQCVDAVAESLVMSAYGAQLLSIRHAQSNVGDLLETVRAIIDDDDGVIGAWHAVFALAAAGAGDTELARRQIKRICAEDFAILDRDYTFNGALFAAALAAADIGAADLAPAIEAELTAWSGRWGFVGTCTMGPIDTALAQLAEVQGDRARARLLAEQALASARHAEAPIYVAQATVLVDRLAD